MTTGKPIALTRRTFVGKTMCLLFDTLSWSQLFFPHISVQTSHQTSDPSSRPSQKFTSCSPSPRPLPQAAPGLSQGRVPLARLRAACGSLTTWTCSTEQRLCSALAPSNVSLQNGGVLCPRPVFATQLVCPGAWFSGARLSHDSTAVGAAPDCPELPHSRVRSSGHCGPPGNPLPSPDMFSGLVLSPPRAPPPRLFHWFPLLINLSGSRALP